MELGAILFSLALALVGGAYVVQPILSARGQAQQETGSGGEAEPSPRP